ncbi:uncharacterized protein LOC130048183 [Ostrea edulis]|uniref:uncharacterized protein LOC130048183 n=1 Tax=Ostrea edulis TaxID=37623 RepID=UPI0024AFDDC2|nr:uncharacterized protein LOC130048183 [Ostrea edulis]
MEATRAYLLHVEEARREREVYKMCVEASKEELVGYGCPLGPIPQQSSSLKKMHYTFDFAHSLILPHHARQIGQLYFTTRRKIHLFGVRLDGLSMQLNYMMDEDETIGTDGSLAHGPISVISMVHHALQTHGLGEIDCCLHADNCGGQNKNRFVLGYFCWRFLVGLHRNISFMLQIPGHTRCLVDAGFGQIKKLYRRTDCDTKGDIARVIELSSKSNKAVCFSDDAWVCRNWKEYLSVRFKAIKGIQQYQQFRFSAEAPGHVFVKRRADSEETRVLLLMNGAPFSSVNDVPAQLIPGGLTEERQRYLYHFVRDLVRPSAQDQTCPAPEE